MKCTFKRWDRPTGLAAVGHKDAWQIKYNKKNIGQISQPDYGVFKVRFQVIKKDINEDGNPNCLWKWIQFKYTGSSIEQTKQWVNDNFELIKSKHQIKFD